METFNIKKKYSVEDIMSTDEGPCFNREEITTIFNGKRKLSFEEAFDIYDAKPHLGWLLKHLFCVDRSSVREYYNFNDIVFLCESPNVMEDCKLIEWYDYLHLLEAANIELGEK